MEFTDEICREIDFLLTMHKKCKDLRTRSLLGGMINVAVEHYIIAELMIKEKGREEFTSIINKGKLQFKDKFSKFVAPLKI